MVSRLQKRFLVLRLNLRARTSLYKRLSQFLAAKISLKESLTRIRDRYRTDTSLLEKLRMRLDSNFRPQGDFRAQILTEWLDQMAEGKRFSDAVKGWIPISEQTLIAAGERGRGLSSGMNEAAGMSMANARMKKTIIGQSIQPLVLTAAVMSMFILFQARMVPIFEKIKPVAAWPSGAVRLYNISYFIEHYLLLVVAAMVGMGYVFLVSLPRWKGPRRAMVDTMPPWSVYRVQQSSAFLIALSSLMTAGVTVYASLQLLHRNGSPYLRWHLERMMSAMSQGADNPGAAMNTGLLDKETAGEVEDYSQLGSFREAIQTIGKQNLEDSLERIALTMGALRNVMLIAVAGTVMWIYGTTYMLQADIANSAGSASGAAGVPH